MLYVKQKYKLYSLTHFDLDRGLVQIVLDGYIKEVLSVLVLVYRIKLSRFSPIQSDHKITILELSMDFKITGRTELYQVHTNYLKKYATLLLFVF